MSTITGPINDVQFAEPVTGPALKVTPARVVRSEWIKLRSVRSTNITLGLVAVAVVALGVLLTRFTTGTSMGPNGPIANPTGSSLTGTQIAQLVLGVLGALLVTTEYATGMIRATLTAVPTRLPVLWAKVAVVAAVAFVVMAVAVTIAFLGGQALYAGDGPGASLSDPGVVRVLLGAAVYPTAIAVMGVALGSLMRQTASAVGVLFGVLFLAPVILGLMDGRWIGDLVLYLPSSAGEAMMNVVPNPELLSPLAGLAVTAGWVVALLTAAAFVLRRRDA